MSGKKHSPIRNVLCFSLRFIFFAVILGILWWYFLPCYGWVLLQITGGVMIKLLAMPILSGYIRPEGVLNTESLIVFNFADYQRAMPIALLVTNLPPYVALVLATAGLGIWKRIRIMIYGCAILVLGHMLYIILLMKYQAAIQGAGEIPYAIIQFYLTLPFLLWVVFAYRDRIAGYFSDTSSGGSEKEPPVSEGHEDGIEAGSDIESD